MSETLRYGDFIIGKEHVARRRFRAVVMRRATNEVVWRAPIIGWTTYSRELCRRWITEGVR